MASKEQRNWVFLLPPTKKGVQVVPDQPGIRIVNGLWRPTYDRFVRT